MLKANRQQLSLFQINQNGSLIDQLTIKKSLQRSAILYARNMKSDRIEEVYGENNKRQSKLFYLILRGQISVDFRLVAT